MSWLGSIGGRLYRGEVSFDFVGRQKLWYKISAAILLISIGALIFRGLSYSVEFKGGDVYKFTAASTVHPTQTQVANTVTAAGGGSTLTVQQVGGSGWSVQTPSLDKTERFNVQDALATRFLGGHKDEVSLSSVGPSWGSQISHKALEALIAFLIVIVLYLSVAFEWRMASAALVALLHDIVITVGVYALFGLQVSPATVIGLLTILGYSLYDTVVVFDKVRENTAGLLATRRTTYSEAANLALNQTLVRSINTSLIADLKERESEYRQLRKQIAQRVGSAKRQAKVAVRNAPGAGQVADDEAEAPEPAADDGAAQASPVTAGRPAGGSAGSRPVSGPRQQPRRPSAAQRRPSGKKKR